ncbi:hypothetical protein B0O99DRAFT_588762 [Bisporella sp. PMI_857]|nr:hypothetical protein B0O99DRAFT_588762 [Bisporella sp. PMI_857]
MPNPISSQGVSRAPTSVGDNSCPICYDSIKKQVTLEPCNHIFDLRCITKWFGEKRIAVEAEEETVSYTCPICRTKSTHMNGIPMAIILPCPPELYEEIDKYEAIWGVEESSSQYQGNPSATQVEINQEATQHEGRNGGGSDEPQSTVYEPLELEIEQSEAGSPGTEAQQ